MDLMQLPRELVGEIERYTGKVYVYTWYNYEDTMWETIAFYATDPGYACSAIWNISHVVGKDRIRHVYPLRAWLRRCAIPTFGVSWKSWSRWMDE